jgi:type IV secretory pathway VirJ component
LKFLLTDVLHIKSVSLFILRSKIFLLVYFLYIALQLQLDRFGMKIWCAVFGAMVMATFSGCGILRRNRMSNHHGIVKSDYGLPVVTYPSSNPFSRRILFLFSGDGGWVEFEDRLATEFSRKGYFVIGFNSRSYFWEKKTPKQSSDDVLLLIEKYRDLYKSNRVFMCGYSFGADVLPFIYNRLPDPVKSRVIAVALLSPFATSDFMVHTSDLLNISEDNNPYKVQPEVEKISIPVYCFYGKDENPKPLQDVDIKNFSMTIVPGNHRYQTSSYKKISNVFNPVRRFFQTLSSNEK